MDNNMNVTTPKENFLQKGIHAVKNGAKKVWNSKLGKALVITGGVIATTFTAGAIAYNKSEKFRCAVDKHNPFRKKEQAAAPAAENQPAENANA